MTVSTIIILGGSSGIGLATAQKLDAAGARVAITGRSPDKLTRAVATLGPQAVGNAMDAADAAQVQALFAEHHPFDHLLIALSGNRLAPSICLSFATDSRPRFGCTFKRPRRRCHTSGQTAQSSS